VALRFLDTLGRQFLTLLNLALRHTTGLLGRGVGPSQDLYLHRTPQHIKMRTNVHALSGPRTHDPSTQSGKTHGLRPRSHCVVRHNNRLCSAGLRTCGQLHCAPHDWPHQTFSLKMEAVCSSQTLVPSYKSKRRHMTKRHRHSYWSVSFLFPHSGFG
jgi:hypothetical protein